MEFSMRSYKMQKTKIFAWLLAFSFSFALVSNCSAEKRASEIYLDAATANIDHSMVRGPRRIALGGGAELTLTKDECFVGTGPTVQFFHALGQAGDSRVGAGMVYSCGLFSEADWFVLLTIRHDGHVNETARTWTADNILHSLQAEVTAANAFIKQRGRPSVEISGWMLPPVYDAAAHNLAWAVTIKAGCSSGCSASEQVSYEAVVLGRSGYVDVFIQPSLNDFPKQKRIADDVRAHIRYMPTAQYTDFKPLVDQSAPYDLTSLLTGRKSDK